MQSSALVCVLTAGAVIGGLLQPRAARGGFEIVSESVEVKKDQQQVLFSIEFSHPPDLMDVNHQGQPDDAFQYEIDGDWLPGQESFGFDRIDAIVRGTEVHIDGTLPVRGPRGPADPDSGGWGRVLAEVPFLVDDNTLSFTVDQSLISDTDGIFQYRALSLSQGQVTSAVHGRFIPLPTAVWGGSSMLAVLVMIHVGKRVWTRRKLHHA